MPDSKPELISARCLFLPRDSMDPLSLTLRTFNLWACRDRFGIMNSTSPYRFHNELFEDAKILMDWKAHTKKDIKETCDKRAKEILNKYSKITVSWSGGVDSTSVVCAFLKNGLDPKDLTIIFSESSIEEYPFFYEHLKKIGAKLLLNNAVAHTYSESSEGAIVSGWCADQLFGSNVHLYNPSLYNGSWTEGVQWFLERNKVNPSQKDWDTYVEAWNVYANTLGVRLEQFCEYAWLFNFGIKWTHVSTAAQLSVIKSSVRNRSIPFFSDVDFQLWSLQNAHLLREDNVITDPTKYKRPLKEYIYSYTNDSSYLANKSKENSWAKSEDRFDWVGVLDTTGYHCYRQFGVNSSLYYNSLSTAVATRYLRGSSFDLVSLNE